MRTDTPFIPTWTEVCRRSHHCLNYSVTFWKAFNPQNLGGVVVSSSKTTNWELSASCLTRSVRELSAKTSLPRSFLLRKAALFSLWMMIYSQLVSGCQYFELSHRTVSFTKLQRSWTSNLLGQCGGCEWEKALAKLKVNAIKHQARR